MKSALLIKLTAAGCLAVALGAGATALPKLTPSSILLTESTPAAADYGLAAFSTLAQWQNASVSAETPMDFGLGAYPTLNSWLYASTGTVPLASAKP